VIVLEAVSLFLAGILAGEETIVRYGIQPALAGMDDDAHLKSRIALVKRLKLVVPIIMVPTVVAAIASLIAAGDAAGVAWRAGGVLALIAFLLFSFLGTVPINIKVNDWDAANPPGDWKTVVQRWQTIDVFRSAAAIVAFACFTVGLALQLA